jgi:nicotinate-nucleotide adenylyltransferase
MKVAIYGGSFDPPHAAHLLAATYVKKYAGVDQVWVLPAFKHPFEKKLAPFEARLKMCKKLFDGINGIYVSDEEQIVGTGFTLDVCRFLTKTYPDFQFRLVLGADIVDTLSKWDGFFEHTCKLAPPIFLSRAGYLVQYPQINGSSVLNGQLPDLSSTALRAKVAAGEDVSSLLSPEVLEVIKSEKLYLNTAA